MGANVTYDAVPVPAFGPIILNGDLVSDSQGCQIPRLSVVDVISALLLLRQLCLGSFSGELPLRSEAASVSGEHVSDWPTEDDLGGRAASRSGCVPMLEHASGPSLLVEAAPGIIPAAPNQFLC